MGQRRGYYPTEQSHTRTHLNAEMDFHLEDPNLGRIAGNSRNGHAKKKVSGAVK